MTTKKTAIHKQYRGLGTNIRLTAFGTATATDLDDAYALVQMYEDRLTVNREPSELMDVNHAAGKHPVAVSEATFSLTKLALLTSRQNFGFNALIGPLVKLWKIGFSDAHVPELAQIKARLALCDPKNVILDEENLTIFLKQAGMELDLGAIAKGYIADRIQDLFKAKGIGSAMIDLGGNLLLTGPAPKHADQKWRIGIQDPFAKRGHSILSVKIGPCSAVTSGIYERQLQSGGKTYHHILDPKTGYPHENNLVSVTVFTKHSVIGEIETTRLFFNDTLTDLENYSFDSEEIFGAVLVTKDRQIKVLGLKQADLYLLDETYTLL